MLRRPHTYYCLVMVIKPYHATWRHTYSILAKLVIKWAPIRSKLCRAVLRKCLTNFLRWCPRCWWAIRMMPQQCLPPNKATKVMLKRLLLWSLVIKISMYVYALYYIFCPFGNFFVEWTFVAVLLRSCVIFVWSCGSVVLRYLICSILHIWQSLCGVASCGSSSA